MPVPVRFTVCGLLAAPSVTVRVPVRVPVWLGVNVTLTTQFALGARRTPLHPSLDLAKSPADGVTVSICSEELFGLVMVTFFGAEVVSTSCLGNVSVSGVMVIRVTAYAGALPMLAISAMAVIAIAASRDELRLRKVRLDRFRVRVMARPLPRKFMNDAYA
jgi:hypothetical protein